MKKELNPVALWSIVAVVAAGLVFAGLRAFEVPLGPQPEVEVEPFQPPAGYVTPEQGGYGQGAGPIGAPKEPPAESSSTGE